MIFLVGIGIKMGALCIVGRDESQQSKGINGAIKCFVDIHTPFLIVRKNRF